MTVMTTDATTGSSAMFSLRELMELEERRVSEEEARRCREAELRREKAEERLLLERREAEARLEEERRAKEARRLREREEQVRLDAIREAELERRRILAEREASMIVQAQLAEQERAAAMRENERAVSGARRTLFVVVSASLLAISGLSFGYFGVLRPSWEQKQLELDRARAEQADSAASARRQVDDLRRTLDEVEAARSARNLPVAAPPRDEPKPVVAVKPTRPVATAPVVGAPPVECPKGDPMCGFKR